MFYNSSRLKVVQFFHVLMDLNLKQNQKIDMRIYSHVSFCLLEINHLK
jgi:hypothetical protein